MIRGLNGLALRGLIFPSLPGDIWGRLETFLVVTAGEVLFILTGWGPGLPLIIL